MKQLALKKTTYSRRIKNVCVLLLIIFSISVCFLFTNCKKEICYFDYVSELRSNIFLAETENFALRVYAVEKESPYATDGIKQETSARTEIYLNAPSGDKTYTISFQAGERTHGGEMSFDNVKAEYYYFCSLDVSALTQLNVTIVCGEETFVLTAHSVLTKNTLTPQSALNALSTSESELFATLTDEYGFAGEIYLRLIYEDSPYYYVGVIDRSGNVTAFLMNAETGKVLAKRQS